MSTRRKIIGRATALLAVVAIVTFMVPFFQSLWPSEKTQAAAPRIDVAAIAPGSILITEDLSKPAKYPGPLNRSQIAIFYRTAQGELKAWGALAENGLPLMPDTHWWAAYFPCENFGPSVMEGMPIIACNSIAEKYPWGAENWRWYETGKSISGQVDDMQPIKGVVEGDYFVFGKRI